MLSVTISKPGLIWKVIISKSDIERFLKKKENIT